MIALTTSAAPSSITQALSAVGAAAVRVGRRFAKTWRHRHDAAALAAFDDRMLADLGLTRGDLNDALAEPMWRDPTSVLARRQSEWRWARRATVTALVRQASPSFVPGADTLAFPPRDPPARLTL